MTYEEALRYYEETAVYGSRLGLDRVRELLAKLGDPQKSLKFVHIAGTNGKGSTAAMLAAVLEKAGYRTGLYTSPHLLRYNERFQVNGKEIGDQDLADATERVKQAADTMPDAPTQFELVTAIAFCLFQAAKCDIVVLEVGLGGRLDATNVIDVPEAAVITRIGLDHTEILGDTVEAIAAEKAGIVKPGKGRIVLATVKGDVHDIGKNIVKVILENYGFEVIDLGRDVPVETVVDTVREKDVHLVGLSALMTTTLKSMEETIAALHAAKLDCKIMVGGAVLTPEYAEKIGADWYAKDAKRSADIAKEFFGV